ncbi:MAG: M28 family peptidase [Treponema sp.]|jgi:hypothetical protein|nr:M28 family peptidase [Treponema sp.]
MSDPGVKTFWGGFPWNRFAAFIAPGADRFALLKSLTEEAGLNAVVIPIGENRHFFVFPPGQNIKAAGEFPFRGQSPVILAAHYDRVPGSPGANDNSAAVFQLLLAAGKLGEQNTGNWIIIFTDKEELLAGEGIQDQGSFGLAEKLKRWGLGKARVFIFDACGTGDTLIVSSTTGYFLKNDERPGLRKTLRLVRNLQDQALKTARQLRMDKVLLIPTPFSDDAGFLRAGIPAQTITALPAGEAAPYAGALRKHPDLAERLISGALRESAGRLLIPETWRVINSSADSPLRLTPETYSRVIRFAAELCRE